MIPFEYRAPETLDEAFELLEQHGDDARLMAGGTALVILMKQRLVQPTVVVSLRRIGELRGLDASDGGVRIGATEPQRRVERHPLVRERFPTLAETVRRVATPRVRNQATVGGNLTHADPNQDPPVTLMALDASVRLRSRAGERSVPLDAFFVDYYETVVQPGEVLTEIVVPPLAANAACAFLKFLPRTADDYATVSAAATVAADGQTCRDVRIVLGAAGPTVVRARAAEALLRGQALTDANLRQAAAAVKDEVDPLSDIRGSAEYKRAMAEVFAYRALRAALDQLPARARAEA